jgi:hypothetical protein
MVDGSPFIDNLSDVLNNKFLYTSLVDENGARSVNGFVMTGTNFTGVYSGSNCNDFTNTTASGKMEMGNNSWAGGLWTDIGFTSCTSAFYLYCFGVDKSVPVTVPAAPTARKVFLTKANWVPGGGLASADALCSAEATAAGLPGTYRAWLETSTAGGLSRFDLAGKPWARPDGVLLTAKASDLIGTTWLARPNQFADGTFPSNSNTYWGNTGNFTSTTNCKNWTSALASDQGDVSNVDNTNGNIFSCDATNGQLLCLQN